jgi:nicotinamidase-related amidase
MAANQNSLQFGLLGPSCVHLCVDMQRMFAEDTAWKTAWMIRVLPKVRELAAAYPDRCIFTRFVPAAHPGQGRGAWRRYYERWASMTIERLGREMVGLIPELMAFVPPAQILDKRAYSPWFETDLHRRLQARSVDALVVSGGETDVCVLSAVLGAIDRGYRVVVATDALCSSSDETHDAMLTVYESRYNQQIEAVATDVILRSWT